MTSINAPVIGHYRTKLIIVSQNFAPILGPLTYTTFFSKNVKMCNKFLTANLHKLLFVISI